MVYAVMNYCGSNALGLEIDLFYFVGIIPACRILTRLPISIAAIGVQEGIYVFFFTLVGATMAEAFTLSIVQRAAFFIAVIPAGGVLYVIDGWQMTHKTDSIRKSYEGGLWINKNSVFINDLALNGAGFEPVG